MHTRKKKIVIRPRFYVICALLIVLIFSFNHDFEGVETFADEPIPSTIIEETMKTFTDELAPSTIVSDIETPSSSIEEAPVRYGFTDEDIYLLAQLLSGDGKTDGDGEYDIDFQDEINYYEVGKVLSVIMNRVRSNDFPNTVRDVVLQKGQFSVMPRNLTKEPSDITYLTVYEWCIAYDNYINLVQVAPKNHLFFTGNGTINITRAKHK